MAQLRIACFGSFQVTLDDQTVAFRSNKGRALLLYLAVEQERAHSRSTLAGLLWPELPEARARQNLSPTLLEVRRAIGDQQAASPFLQISAQQIAFAPTSDHWLDVTQFGLAIANHDYAQSAKLYQGEFLTDFLLPDSEAWEQWAERLREAYRQQEHQAHLQWAATLEVGGQWSDALAVTRRLLTHAPWHEEAHCTLMRLLARSGQRSAALAHYDTLTQILLDELGVPPAPTTNALYDQILAGALRRRRAHWHLSKKVRILSCLDPLPVQDLFGTERARERIYNVLQQTDRPWLVVLDGIGGIGKTTLATLLVHDFVKSERFAAIAWVSAKQEEFRPTGGLATTGRPALDEATLTNTLLEQLTEQPPLSASNQEKQQLLYQLLHERSMLVIVDNLESVADYQALVPYLRQLANPSKFLITSRYTLQSYSDVYCYSLTELEASDALAFLRHEAATRNNSRLADATDAQLEMIYAVVGGNPLALKLVIGQLTFLPLAQVLSNLREARGKRIDQLYTYIYWQAWQMLTEPSRQLLLSLPVVPNGTFAQLALASELDIEDLQEALAQLHALSLVQTGGDLDEPRYPLHRLTETFLMQEVLSWQ